MEHTEPTPKYVSLAEAAQYAGCSQRFLRRRIAAGDLVSSLVGGRRFVTLAAIDQMMEQHSNRQPKKGRGIRHAPRATPEKVPADKAEQPRPPENGDFNSTTNL